jgi:hypothetical protein
LAFVAILHGGFAWRATGASPWLPYHLRAPIVGFDISMTNQGARSTTNARANASEKKAGGQGKNQFPEETVPKAKFKYLN